VTGPGEPRAEECTDRAGSDDSDSHVHHLRNAPDTLP
jgi:hypothetical protein